MWCCECHLNLVVLQRHHRLEVALRIDLLRVVLVSEHGDQQVGHQDGRQDHVDEDDEDGVEPQHGVDLKRLLVLGGREDVEAHLEVADKESEQQEDDIPARRLQGEEVVTGVLLVRSFIF